MLTGNKIGNHHTSLVMMHEFDNATNVTDVIRLKVELPA